MSVPNIASLFSSQGLEPSCKSMHNGPASYFTPIQSEGREKVDILELLQKAKVDLKPLLSTLSVNKARLQESSECHLKKNILRNLPECHRVMLYLGTNTDLGLFWDSLLKLINGYRLMFYAQDL